MDTVAKGSFSSLYSKGYCQTRCPGDCGSCDGDLEIWEGYCAQWSLCQAASVSTQRGGGLWKVVESKGIPGVKLTDANRHDGTARYVLVPLVRLGECLGQQNARRVSVQLCWGFAGTPRAGVHGN